MIIIYQNFLIKSKGIVLKILNIILCATHTHVHLIHFVNNMFEYTLTLT
jgi:hypothetical protein